MNSPVDILASEAIQLLQQLIRIPSFSREEDKTADLLSAFITSHTGSQPTRVGNNIFLKNKHYDPAKKTILLNSHHDTVKPNRNYTLDPFEPNITDDKLYGLGSNDAGGCLVSLLAVFLYFYEQKELTYNVIFGASAEEEISGKDGIELLIPALPEIDFALVGEPTKMEMAVAERGLMVIDCTSQGVAGHAARKEGINAIELAIKDINWINGFEFEKLSPLLGPSRMTVTVIETDNKAHNVVPAQCRFVVDARINELYAFEEVLDIMKANMVAEISPRSTRLRSTSIALDHPVVLAGKELEMTHYGSPTTSDKALMPFPALKIGPGDSARSHTADEFIFVKEIRDGIATYIRLLEKIV
jgi:acetylornithine deacetylase